MVVLIAEDINKNQANLPYNISHSVFFLLKSEKRYDKNIVIIKLSRSIILPQKDKKARRSYNSEYSKKWYAKNKKKKKEQAKKSRKRAVRRNRKYVEKDKLANPCPCGEFEPCCLSYHHYNGNKEGNISDMVNRGYSITRIQKEIDKCKVMCLNCHAKLHKHEKLKLAAEELEKELTTTKG